MYSIVTTKGFVIDSRPYGEAGKLLYIYTQDHGLVVAVAQGIRLEKSKLRPFTQDYSFSLFSFVKGREYWRLTNAQESKKNNTELMAKISLLLKNMLHGEEPNPELFDVINSINTVENKDSLESLIVLRMLHKLGYIGDIKELNTLLNTNEITDTILNRVEKNRVFINTHINRAIKESHL